MESIKTNQLNFFIAHQKSVVIVTFVGPLSRESVKTLEACSADVLKLKPRWVILNFRDVPSNMDKAVGPPFALFQKKIRENGAGLRVSAMHPDLKNLLDHNGLI